VALRSALFHDLNAILDDDTLVGFRHPLSTQVIGFLLVAFLRLGVAAVSKDSLRTAESTNVATHFHLLVSALSQMAAPVATTSGKSPANISPSPKTAVPLRSVNQQYKH
jgi:hypothetical protein